MTAVFESILHMSAVASIVILTVIVLRFCLKSAPKKFSYILWALVLVRLLCPVSLESPLSTIPKNNGAEEILEDWSNDYVEDVIIHHEGSTEYDRVVEIGNIEPVYIPNESGGMDSYVVTAPDGVTPAATVKTEWMPILAIVWLCGIAAMAAWAVIDYLRLRYRLRTAVREEKGVYMTDAVDSPFVLGLFRPKIYLPAALGESEREYILMHERCHIRRGDHWIKLLAFAALALHWFNPLVWLAFVLANRDMEMSCDEAVIKSLGGEVRADYSASLLALATGRRRVSVTPLAFGEGDPKGRIRNLANWRKPTVWIIIVSVVVCIVAAVCLLTDPKEEPMQSDELKNAIITEDGYTIEHQNMVNVKLNVPEQALSKAAYTPTGQSFDAGEVVVYDDGNSMIWLRRVQQSNESENLLYFTFAISYELRETGGVLFSVDRYEGGGSTACTGVAGVHSTLTADNGDFEAAVSLRGGGPDEQFAFYVDADACRQAEGTLSMQAMLNRLVYTKNSGMDASELPYSSTEVARGDFDHDGREDYFEVRRYDNFCTLRLWRADGAELLWEAYASEDELGQMCFIALKGEDGLDYITSCQRLVDTNDCICRTFHIDGNGAALQKEWTVELTLPETDSEAEFIELMSLSLPRNSTVLLSTLGGITVVGPVNRPAEASPTELAWGDFDHDGEEETVMLVPDGQYGDMWDLCVTEPEGKVIWTEEDFNTSHPGWNSILSTTIDGRDYLVRYNPYMSTGLASYICEVFYIQNGGEVTVQEWRAEFYANYNPPMEITSEMAEFAAAVNELAPRCTLLFSTLDGEVLSGPVSAVESGVMTVDYLLGHCRGLVQHVGWSDYYSFESKYFVSGWLAPQPEYPAISAWVCGDDWLYISESEAADGGVTRQIDIQKDGRHYVWLSTPMGESVHETDPEGYDQYFWWLKNGSLGTHLSFESELRSSDGLTLNYVELFETEAGTVSSGTHSYVLDKNGVLESYSATSSGVTRTVIFPAVSEAMCRQMIDEAFAELMAALELDALDPISIYGLEEGLCDGSFGLRWGTKESVLASQPVYEATAVNEFQTRYDYVGVANLCFADVPCSFSAHCTDGMLSGITMRFAAKSGEQVKTIEKVYKLLKQGYGDVEIYEEPINGAYADFGVYAGSHRWDVKSGDGRTVVVRLAVNGESSFILEMGVVGSD